MALGASHFGTFVKDKGLKPLVLGLVKLGIRQSEMLPMALPFFNLVLVVGNYSSELEKLRGREHVYFADSDYAQGILEAIAHYQWR